MIKRYAFVLILLLGYMTSDAQEVLVKHINRAMGLPTNKIYSITQDKKGYIWLGTERGLVRYDGMGFKTYTHTAMNGFAVSDVQEDKQNRIWCQNFIGQHFYLKNDTFHYAEELGASGIYSPMSIDSDHKFFFLGRKCILVCNIQLKPIDSIAINDYLTFSFIYKNKLHFFSQGEIFNYSNGKLHAINGHLTKAPSFARTFSFVLKDRIYTFPKPVSGKHLYQVYPEFKAIPLPKLLQGSLIQSVNVLRDSIICLNTTNGTILMNTKFELLVPFTILPKYSISAVYMDSKSRYWITSTEGGLFLLESLNKLNWPIRENSASCASIYGPEKSILIGSKNGELSILDNKSNKLKKLRKLQGNNTLRKLKYSEVQGRLMALNDYIQVYEGESEIIRYRAAGKDIIPIANNSIAFAATGLCGLILLNNSNELDQWKPQLKLLYQKKEHKIYQFKSESLSLRNQAIQYDSSKERFIIATSKGVLELNKDGSERALTLGSDAIVADKLCLIQGELLALSANKGIFKETINGFELPKTFAVLSQHHLIDVKVHQKEVYVLSENGVYKISPKDWSVQTLYFSSSTEELIGFEFLNQTLYVLTEGGLQTIPLHNRENLEVPIIEITQILANKQPILTKGNKLNHSQNNVKINFQLPYYGLASLLNITYRVNQGPWTFLPSGTRNLEFFSLSPGNYKIEITGKTAGETKQNITGVEFEILEPFWKRWWFYLALVLVSAGIMGVFYTYRIKQIRIRTKLLEQNIRLESNLRQSMLTSIKAQMNPHFVFNALNSIQSYIYLNDKQNATRFLSKFSSLTRKILEMSSEDFVSIEDELSALKLYLELEKMRFEEVFEYSLEYNLIAGKNSLRLPSMIIQPYVENAIKHGLLHKEGKRELQIRFQWEDPYLLVEIEDNGIGREASGKLNRLKQGHHKSFSSSANQKRLELLQKQEEHRLGIEYKDKVDENGNACGTLVKLSIRATYSSHNPAS